MKEIKLDGANVVLEQRGISGNNLQDIGKEAAKTGTGAGKEVIKGAEKVGKGITEGL